MICCTECFKDKEIKSIIKSLNKRSDCETCGSKNVYIYDTEEDVLLANEFDELLNIYVPVNILPSDYPREKLNLLKEELYYNWDIFNLEKDMIYRIITNICKEKYENNHEIFDLPVGIPEMVQQDYLAENSLLKTYSWEDFVSAIKMDNRFHTNYVNTKVLEILCSYVNKLYKEGATFFRARISSKEGFSAANMGAPPPEKATAGRANSSGISCLYLANNEMTALHEIRAAAYDYVTIGKFILKQDIHVVDLTSIDKISAFSELNCTQHAINKKHLGKISYEIAKPLKRSDTPLDYLPTQYISDFIKSIKHDGKNEYSGIEYKSTMCRNGYNLAIFDQYLFECKSVDVIYVKELQYII